jgi:uncharacterized protein YbjT (DUF2867 family)
VQTRSALLVGASGLVGGHLLQLLLDDESYHRVTVLVRRPLLIQHPKLQESVIHFDQIGQHRTEVQGDDVFCCLGTTILLAGSEETFRKIDFTYVVQIAALASGNGAEQFLLVSSLGADVQSRIFYSRVKGEVEQAVTKLPFKSIHIFRPSFILGDRKEPRPYEKIGIIISKFLSFVLVGNWRKYRAIHAQTVAKAMLLTAKQREPGVNIIDSQRMQSMVSG